MLNIYCRINFLWIFFRRTYLYRAFFVKTFFLFFNAIHLTFNANSFLIKHFYVEHMFVKQLEHVFTIIFIHDLLKVIYSNFLFLKISSVENFLSNLFLIEHFFRSFCRIILFVDHSFVENFLVKHFVSNLFLF